MALVDDYKKFGFNQFLEKQGSLLVGFQPIQFYKTGSLSDDGLEETEEISSGLITLKTDKLGSQEIKEQLGRLKTLGAGGDVTQPINVVFGHIQSANFVSESTGWRIDSNGDLEANTGTFRGALKAGSIDIGSGLTSFHVDIHGNMWLGSESFNLSVNPFGVSSSGALRAISGNIAAFHLSYNTIYSSNLTIKSGTTNVANISVGSGSNAAGMNAGSSDTDIAFWAGASHTNRDDAKFKVTLGGSVIATDFVFAGTEESATIGGWVVDENELIGGASQIITGGTIRTSDPTANLNRIEIIGSAAEMRFVGSDATVVGEIEPIYAAGASYLSGITLRGGAGFFTATTTKNLAIGFTAMQHILSGTDPAGNTDNKAEININFSGGDTNTFAIKLIKKVNGVFSTLPFNDDLIPFSAGQNLGYSDAANRWTVGYINKISGLGTANVIDFGIAGRIATNQDFTPSAGTLNLGATATANRWAVGYINRISGLGTGNVIDLGVAGCISSSVDFTFPNITSESLSKPAGTIHWNSSEGALRVWDGSLWKSLDMT